MTDTIEELIAAGVQPLMFANSFFVQDETGKWQKVCDILPTLIEMHETIKLLEADKERMIEKLGEILTIAADADERIAELAREGLGGC